MGPGADSRGGGLPEGSGKGALSGRAGRLLLFGVDVGAGDPSVSCLFLAVGHPVERQACEDESAWFAPFIEDADISVAHGGQA